MARLFVDDYVVSEGDAFVDIVVRLDAASSVPVAVDYRTLNGTAFGNGSDFLAVNGTLIFDPGETDKTVRVSLIDNPNNNGFETGELEHFRFQIGSPTGGATLGRESGMVTIVDNDNPIETGQPLLFARDVRVDEKAGTADFVVLLGGPRGQSVAGPVTVDYTVDSGTAQAGSDFDEGDAPFNGTLTFLPGETAKTVRIHLNDDAVSERLERFTLQLSNPDNAQIVDGHAVASIGLSDLRGAGTPIVSVGDQVVGEGDGYVDVAVTMSAPSAGLVTVGYRSVNGTAFGNGSDFTGVSGDLVFAPGETTKTVRIELEDQPNTNGFETGALEHFVLHLDTPVGGAVLGQDEAMVSIVDNDNVVALGQPQLFVRDVVADEKSGTARFVVLLGGPQGQHSDDFVSVDYAVAPGTARAGSDYVAGDTPLTGQLVFAPGETVKTVSVDLVDDTLAEGVERFVLNLSHAEEASILDGRAVAEIGASDVRRAGSPVLSVDDRVVGEGDGYVDMVVRLSAASDAPVTVDYRSVNGSAFGNSSDFVGVSGRLNFAAGEMTKTVRVELIDNPNTNGFETGDLEHFVFRLATPTGNAVLGQSDAMVSIVDNDNPVATGEPQLFVRGGFVDEKDGTAQFTVMLGGVRGQISNEAVAVRYAVRPDTATAGSDYVAGATPLSGQLLFAPGETVKTISVDLRDDARTEALERLHLVLSGAQGGTIVDGNASLVIAKSDARAAVQPSLSVADQVMSEADGWVEAVVQLSAPSTRPVTVDYRTSNGTAFGNGSDFVGVTGQLRFEAGETLKTVRIELSDQPNTNGFETGALESFSFVLASATNAVLGRPQANFTIVDDDNGVNVYSYGVGNDVYRVDFTSDLIVENPLGGIDLVLSSVDYTLGDQVENLTLVGAAAIDGRGNVLANRIVGNAAGNRLDGLLGNDTLNGAGGNDTMFGGGGGDTYVVDRAGDVVREVIAAGIDTVQSSVSYVLGPNVERLTLTGTAPINGTGNGLANLLTGNAAANRLSGGAGNDTLIGGAGADVMTGGAGNDLYVVDRATDRVVEGSNGGIDTVSSRVSFILGANLERLTLSGTAAVNATGNGAANLLTGNAAANRLSGGGGNDTLNGGAGNDTMTGGAGSDTYVVNVLGDRVVETAGVGSDTVLSAVSYTLGANLERLTLTGAAANGAGNTLANVLTGNAGANRLSGSGGNDTLRGLAGSDTLLGGAGADVLEGGVGRDQLTGGTGGDHFRFASAPSGANADRITDFRPIDDRIDLDNGGFTRLGAPGHLAAAAFRAGTVARDTSDRVIFNENNGQLLYDPDGTGSAHAVLFATVTPGVHVTVSDLFVV